MNNTRETAPGVFYLLFFGLLCLIAVAGKVVVDLKNLEREAVRAQSQWVALYETSTKLFSFSSLRARHERGLGAKERTADLAKDIQAWQHLRDQFESSLGFFQKSPYQVLLQPSTRAHVRGAWEAWALTRQKIQKSRDLFERVLATPLGEKLVAYSYKELIEDAVTRDHGRAKYFSKKDMFLFYRLQDSLGDLELSGDVFTSVLTRISEQISRRITVLVILISLLVFCIACFIVGAVMVITRHLRESRRRFQAIFDQTFQFTGLMTPDGILLEVNKTALDFAGLSAEEVLNRPFSQSPWWQHSKEAQRSVQEAIARAAGGEFIRQEITISDRHGQEGVVDFSLKPITDDRGRVILLIPEGRDITERKRMEDALRLNEARHAATVELAVDGILLGSAEGIMISANSQMQKLAGRPLKQMLGRHVQELFSPAELKERPLRFDLLNEGQIIVHERRLLRPDGSMVDVEMHSKRMPDGTYQSIYRDITERKRAEEELRRHRDGLEDLVRLRTAELSAANERLMAEIEGHKKTENALEGSRAYLDKIINSIADPIFVKDRRHAWVLLNNVFCDFMGKTRQELLGKSDYDFFPKNEADVFWAKDEEVFNSGQENINEEFFTDGAGKTRTIITKKTLYTDSEGNKILVGIIRDITELRNKTAELKAAYEQLVALQARMIQAEKMASLGQLAAGVAHEINNPAAYILCNLTVLRDYEKNVGDFLKSLVALSSDVGRYEKLADKFNIPKILEDCPNLVDETMRGVERIQKIVQDLRIFAHPDVGQLEYGDLHSCIDGALGILGSELRQKADVIRQYGQIPLVRFKEQQMLQVFINLLSNASHAIEDKGTITIKTYADGDSVFVDITDTGCGIPENLLYKIFDPFFTTKPVGRGTGLGLSVVHGIIQQHQGVISVRSQVGEGTTFTVHLLRQGPAKKAA